MGVLTKYDQTEAICLPQSVVTYIYLHPVYKIRLHAGFMERKCNTWRDGN
jgi:hypothetical protein